MKFDNVLAVDEAPHPVQLPLGSSVVTFQAKYVDRRSAEYYAIMQKVNKPFQKMIDAGTLPPERDRELAIRSFIRASLTGWDGVMSDGQPVPFTEANCLDLLTQMPTLFYDLLTETMSRDNYLPSEAETKNSVTSSEMN